MKRIKSIVMLMVLMLMGFQAHSQTTSTENRVRTFIDNNGDTLVIMDYEDARVLLNDVLMYEYTDSLLTAYMVRDTLNQKLFIVQKNIITTIDAKNTNLKQINSNLNEVIKNKDVEIEIKDGVIEEQRKEIRKQKILKVIGFVGSVALPILTLILVL